METFLVEDVILTLGNLRGSLSWFVRSEIPGDQNRYRLWLERIDRQIESLEDRARGVFEQMRAETPAPSPPAARRIAPDTRVRPPLKAEDRAPGPLIPRSSGLPVFRSQRHGQTSLTST